MFNAAMSKEEYQRIPEINQALFGARSRGAGIVQADTWRMHRVTLHRRKQKLFVVVTCIDERWGRDVTLTQEPYALVVTLSDRQNI